MIFSNACLIVAVMAMIPAANAQILGEAGSMVSGGITLMTDVKVQLDRDQQLKILTDAMGDEECGSLAIGKEIYENDSYFTDIPHYTGSKGTEMMLYEEYYGEGFLGKWVDAAFNNQKATFSNSIADFSNLPADTDGSGECVGREEAIKKGIGYTSTYIDMNQYFQEALDKIKNDGCVWSESLYINCETGTCELNPSPCKDAVNAWEKGIASWSGSIEGEYGRNLREPGEYGKWLQALAGKRCANFKTCGLDSDDSTNKGVTPRANMNIISAFSEGRKAVFNGHKKAVTRIISEINKELTIVRIQGTLRYAYRIGKNLSKKDKEIAEGGAFAFGLLPQIYACNKKAALVVSANTDIGGEKTSQQNDQKANFNNVRAALECNYQCLGIRYSDVGELNDCVDEAGEKTLCFKKKKDSGDICSIKNGKKWKEKCAKLSPKENINKTYSKTRFGFIAKKEWS